MGKPLPRIQETRMTRVPFGTTSSPFLLAATMQYHFNHVAPLFEETAAKLKKSFYVDDLVLGVSTAEEAVELYKQTNKIMELAGMKMQKWATNCELLRRTLQQNGETLPTESHWTKVLGLYWNTKEDKLSVNLDSVLKTESPGNTK